MQPSPPSKSVVRIAMTVLLVLFGSALCVAVLAAPPEDGVRPAGPPHQPPFAAHHLSDHVRGAFFKLVAYAQEAF